MLAPIKSITPKHEDAAAMPSPAQEEIPLTVLQPIFSFLLEDNPQLTPSDLSCPRVDPVSPLVYFPEIKENS